MCGDETSGRNQLRTDPVGKEWEKEQEMEERMICLEEQQ